MQMARLPGLGLALLLLGCLCAPAALADEAAQIYSPGQVFFIDLTLSPTEKAKLEAEPGEYVKGTFSMEKSSDGTPSGTEVPFVSSQATEIRLKGNVGGSFRGLSKKAAFKLKFKKTETVLGLRKMTLNNMVQDPSMLHETLAYAAFRAAGVSASRTGYAYVRLNGEDIGTYLDLENLDETGLTRIFGSFDKNTQHLYEGEDGHDVSPGEASEFEVDEGSEGDISDLENLIEVVNGAPGEGESWSEHVSARANLTEMTKMWAVEKYIDHWDGYSGHAEPNLKPNNYYLFSEPSGRFQMLPWGADQTWIPTKGFPSREVTFEGKGGVLFNKCLEDAACFRQYWEALKEVTTAITAFGPQALAESTATTLAPWQAEEIANGRPEYDATEIKEGSFGVDETIEFIEGRQAEAETWLAENEPPPIEVPPINPPSGGSRQTPSVSTPPVPGLLFVHSARSGRRLNATVQVAGAGFVSLRASVKTKKGRSRVCEGGTPIGAARKVTLRCKLSKAAMSALKRHVLRLKLIFTVTLADGRTETVVRFKRLARS
jgi:hypothetical protein